MNGVHRLAKRSLDLLVSVGSLTLLAPLLLVIAAAIRLTSPGPVLFRQMRLGLNGAPFEIFKFRTMIVDAPDIRNPDGSTFNSNSDPRVTPIGAFLRQTSLDEVPQFLNVLRGEMTLVGPRPDLTDQLKYYSEEEHQRLTVKPGVTGLAQISGRNSIAWQDRKRLDIRYVREQNFWLDIRVLLRTIPYVCFRKGVFVPPPRDSHE